MVFNAVFNSILYIYITTDSTPIRAFLEFFQPVLGKIFFLRHWLLFHKTVLETMDSGERAMDLVAMTIINPRNDYLPTGGSNQGPPQPVLESCALPIELWGSTFLGR